MRRFTKNIVLLTAILAIVCAVAGCEATKSAIASISPTRSISVSAGSSAGSSPPSPSVTAATPTSQASATSGASTPAATAQPSSSPTAGGGSGSGLIWLWVLLGVIILTGLIVAIVRARGRRSAAAGSWRSSVVDAYAKGSALHDAMSVAETPGALGAYDAGARWSDIQRRADDLTQTLYALREAAPDDESRARVADVLVSLQTVRSAMDAERAPGGADARQAEVARERLAFFETSLRALRGPDQQAF
jgi:hypothetical protein